MIKDTVKATGKLQIQRLDQDMKLVESVEIPNLVVDLGKEFIASRMVGTSQAVMSHIAVGTVNTAPAGSQTTLGSELARVVVDTTPSNTANSVTYTATFGPGVGTGSLVEAGIFNAASVGTMLARTTFGTMTKAAGDTTIVSWTVTVS